MNHDRKVSRRVFVLGTAGIAGGTLAARSIAAQGGSLAASIRCTCAADDYAALRAGARGAPTTLKYALFQAANIPTPRAETMVFTQSTNQVWDSFNPYIPNGEAYQYGVNQACREGMFYVNFVQGKVIPWLALSYKYNADFTGFTLNLNPAAMWSDGQPYSSDDVVYSVNLLKDNTNYTGADQISAFVDTVTATDPHTVDFKLKAPNPRFHYLFTIGIVNEPVRVVPKHIWEKQDTGTFKNNPPIYTGPYVLDQTIPDQFMQVWKKAPNYWNKANLDPKPNYIVVRQFQPPDAEVQEFTNGNIDIPTLPFLNMQAVKDSYSNWQEFDFADPCPRGIWLNQDSPSGLFAKAEGRWALSYLVDRKTIGDTIWSPPTPPAQYPWASYSINDRWTNGDIADQYPLDFDLDKAGQLLDSIGATKNGDKRQLNGKDISLTMITPTNVGDPEYQIGTLVATNAKKVGIDIQVKALPGTPFNDAYQLGDYDLTSHWLCGVALDPNQLYGKFLDRQYKPVGTRTTQDNNETRTQIPALNDAALKLEQVNPDDPANKALFDTGLEAFMANLPAMPSIQTTYPFAFGTEYWTNWPTADNNYNIAANWWAQFLFVIGGITPATQ
jgi:peptide/nickel transport system substrate-binding protein